MLEATDLGAIDPKSHPDAPARRCSFLIQLRTVRVHT